MVPLLKVAAIGVAGAGICCVGWWVSSISGVPPCRDLFSDSDFDNSTGKPYNNKYATDYAKYFVGVSDKAKQGSEIDNKAWWDWAFKNRYQTSTEKKKGFENVTSGDNLKTICGVAYKSESNKVSDTQESNITHNESNVWDFCSIGGNKPISVYVREEKGKSYSEGTYGKTESNSKLLISTKDPKNDWFWKIKEVEFFTPNTYSEASSDSSSEFKTLHDNRSQYMDFTHFKVKELCGKAYSQSTTTSTTTFPKKVVFKFCSLKGQEPAGSSG